MSLLLRKCPGNLLRTPDGRLCILDWGMTINVPTDLQLSLLEFIADLNAENYEDVPSDLVKLQFVPEDKIDELRQSGLTVAISNMLKLAAEGGGPKGAMKRMVAQNKEKYADALKEFDDLDSKEATEVRQRLFREDWQREMAEDSLSRGDIPSSTTADVTMKIEQLQEKNADVFAIPDYFVYMSRAFSTLEGIGLLIVRFKLLYSSGMLSISSEAPNFRRFSSSKRCTEDASLRQWRLS